MQNDLENTLRTTGFSRYCGTVIDEISDGKCTAHMDINDNLLNPRKIVHGGAIFTLMDTAAGTAAVYAGGRDRHLVSRSSDIHYILPVTGKTMKCVAEVIRSGKSMALSRADIYDESDRLCATATFEFFYLD